MFSAIGCGVSLTLLSSMLLIQEHFHKHRSIATSIAFLGLPIGNAVSPFITNYLLEEYGWRGALVLHSGILLNTIILAMMFLPVKQQQTRKVEPSLSNFCQTFWKSFVVMKRLPVICFTVSLMAFRFNAVAYFDHAPSRMVFLGFDLAYAGYILTLLGLGILVARIICIIITALWAIEPFFGLGCAVLAQSVLSLSTPMFTTFIPLAVVSVLYGCGQGECI